jgi:hypothetical protein
MKWLVTLILLFAISLPAQACIGARAAGMGYAQIACVDDASAAYWNFAALPDLKNSFEFTEYYNPRLRSSNISFAIIQGNYGFCYVNETVREYTFLSYGKKINNDLSYGVAIGAEHYFWNNQSDINGAFALKYKNDYIDLGLLIQNYNVRPSIALQTKNIVFAIELYDAFGDYPSKRLRSGLEYNLNIFSFRIGEEFFPKEFAPNPMYCGLGIALRNIKIDVAKDFNNNIITSTWSVKF